jgi:hypothetical protein
MSGGLHHGRALVGRQVIQERGQQFVPVLDDGRYEMTCLGRQFDGDDSAMMRVAAAYHEIGGL